MGKLIATREILYQGRIYKVGEALPCMDPQMVQAWLEAGSVKDTLPATSAVLEAPQPPPDEAPAVEATEPEMQEQSPTEPPTAELTVPEMQEQPPVAEATEPEEPPARKSKPKKDAPA